MELASSSRLCLESAGMTSTFRLIFFGHTHFCLAAVSLLRRNAGQRFCGSLKLNFLGCLCKLSEVVRSRGEE